MFCASGFEGQQFFSERAEFGVGVGVPNEGNDHEL
jgi:hypothetical protein